MMTTGAERSSIMRAVKSHDTGPEMKVRQITHGMGYRYRLHRKDLPGKPDLVFPSRGKIIFVHGCFWHGHTCKRGARVPKTNTGYWRDKISRNKERDAKHITELEQAGWKVLVVWECEVREKVVLSSKLGSFLQS